MGLLIGIGQTKPQFAYDYYYGIEWDINVADSSCTRIGKKELHALLPVQARMRRCLLNDDGTVNYYLHATDSTKRDNGAAADLTGASGQVMVEVPEHYIRFEMEGSKRRCLMASTPLPGFLRKPVMYISAYEATVERSVNKLASVVNLTAGFRGGNNSATNDANSATLLGKPAGSISLTNFRTYARNRGSTAWNCNTYEAQKTLNWLMAVEYANLNCQLPFNAQLTSEGYKQGGLGDGVTDLNSGKWSAFNGSNPFVPCGFTNSLGNASGVKPYAMPAEYDAVIFTTNVPSYRGIENPFGHIWKITDGCKCNIKASDAGGVSEFYVCNDPAKYQDADYTDYELRGLLPRSNNYIKEVILGEFGEMMPAEGGGSATTYWSDYFYTSIPDNGESQRAVFFGGVSSAGAYAGVRYSSTHSSASSAHASHGSRLCFMGV